jgi:hypothetical protein
MCRKSCTKSEQTRAGKPENYMSSLQFIVSAKPKIYMKITKKIYNFVLPTNEAWLGIYLYVCVFAVAL